MSSEAKLVPFTATSIIQLAWSRVLSAVWQMPLLFLSAALAMAVIGAGARWMGGTAAAEWGPAVSAVSALAILVLGAIVMATVAVAVHRYIILDETTPGIMSFKAKRVWIFAAWAFAMECLGALIQVPGRLDLPVGTAGILTVLALVAVVVAGVRLSLIFPAVAVEAPHGGWKERITASLNMTRGRFWLIFLAGAGAVLPVVLLLAAPSLVLLFEAMRGSELRSSFGLLYGWSIVFGLMRDLLRPVIVGLGAAVASWVYLWMIEHPPAAEPRSGAA